MVEGSFVQTRLLPSICHSSMPDSSSLGVSIAPNERMTSFVALAPRFRAPNAANERFARVHANPPHLD